MSKRQRAKLDTCSNRILQYLNEDPPGVLKKRIEFTGGFGLFADRDFDKGQHIINYRGKHVDHAEADPYVYNYNFNRVCCTIRPRPAEKNQFFQKMWV